MVGKKILFISTSIYPIVGGDTIYSSGLIYRLSKNNNVKVLTFGENNDFVNHKIYKNVKVICFSITVPPKATEAIAVSMPIV